MESRQDGRSRGIDIRKEPDIVSAHVADDVILVGFLVFREDVRVNLVTLTAVEHPVSLTGEASRFAPRGLDGPRPIVIATNIGPTQEFRELIGYSLSLENGRLLVEDAVDFDEVRIGISDAPAVPTGFSLTRFLVAIGIFCSKLG